MDYETEQDELATHIEMRARQYAAAAAKPLRYRVAVGSEWICSGGLTSEASHVAVFTDRAEAEMFASTYQGAVVEAGRLVNYRFVLA